MCVSVLHSSSCLGAVLFLPLVDYHLSECLEALCSSAAAGSDSAAAVTSIALTNVAATHESRRLETGLTGFSVEEAGLAALRLLYLLVSHSDEVMSQQNQFKQKHTYDCKKYLWYIILKITTCR